MYMNSIIDSLKKYEHISNNQEKIKVINELNKNIINIIFREFNSYESLFFVENIILHLKTIAYKNDKNYKEYDKNLLNLINETYYKTLELLIFQIHNSLKIKKIEIDNEIRKKNKEQIFKDKLTIITDNLFDNERLNVLNMASEMAMSRSSLYKNFKRNLGVTPIHYITNYKLEKAYYYIVDENYSIKDAAFISGFKDIKYFRKCFKNKFDVTPSKVLKLKKL